MDPRDIPSSPLSWRRAVLPALGFFTMTFGVWILPGSLISIAAAAEGFDLRASTGVVTLSLLSASGGRIVVGWLSARFEAKLLAMGLACSAALGATLLAWPAAWRATPGLLAIAMLLGLAGSTFPLVMATTARHTEAGARGLALGIVGMGNAGGLLGGALAATVTPSFGWRVVPAAMALGCLGVGAWYASSLRPAAEPDQGEAYSVDADAPSPTPKPSGTPRYKIGADGWGAAIAYAVTFGNFVGLTAVVPVLATHTGAESGTAAALGAAAALAGTLARPVGGALADRLGDVKPAVSSVVAGSGALVIAAAGAGLLHPNSSRSASRPTAVALTGIVAATLFFGCGAGASFAWVGRRAAASVGPLGGFAGAAGAAWGAGVSQLMMSTSLSGTGHGTGTLWLTMLTITAVGVVTILQRTEPASTAKPERQRSPGPQIHLDR